MERFFRIFGREYGNINQAAFLLGSFAFLSQILGLLRDRFIAHFIGPSPELDAYYAAFRIPDLIFISIASLASITVLIPFVTAKLADGKITAEARKFLDDVFTVFLFAMLLVSLVVFFLMPHLVALVVPGFAPALQAKVIMLSRIMLLSPILLGLSNLFGSITQLFRKFFIYALSPIFYNFGITGLAAGVVLGALMHFLIQAFAGRGSGFAPRFSVAINFKEIKRVVLTSLPRTLGLSFNNIALISIISLASYL